MAIKEELAAAVETIGEEDELSRQKRLRKKGISAADRMAQRSEAAFRSLGARAASAEEAIREAGQVGRAGMRMQAAQALRAAGAAPGGNIAALRQSGMATGQALSEQEAQTTAAAEQAGFKMAGAVGQAGVEAAGQELESAKFEREAGSTAEDRQMKIKEYYSQIAKIKKDHKGGLGGILPDDEQGAGDAIMALAQSEPDPQIKKFLESQANAAYEDI